MRELIILEGYLEIWCQILTRRHDLGDMSLHPRGSQGETSGTRVPGAQILGWYEELLVSVTGVGRVILTNGT